MDFNDYSTTFSSINDSHKETPHQYIVNLSIDWLLFLVATASVIAEIYVIIIIKKYKKLQTYQNLLILKIVCFHLGYIMLGEVLILFVTILSESVKSEGYCFLRNLDFLCLDLTYFLVMLLAFDWFVIQYHPNFYQRRLVKFRKWGLCICCLVLLPEALLTSIYCFADTSSIHLVRHIFQNMSFFLCFIAVTIMCILKKRRPLSVESRKYQYCFTISYVFLIMCLPRNVTYLVMDFYIYMYHKLYGPEFMILRDITIAIFLSAPMVMLYLLSKSNKHFKIACAKSSTKKRSETYTRNNIDDENPHVNPQTTFVSYSKSLDSVQLSNQLGQ